MTIVAKLPRWLPLVAAILTLYAVVTLVVRWRGEGSRGPDRGAGVALDTAGTDPLVARALAQIPPAPIDSTEIKTGWRDEVPGIDLAALAPARREVFLRYANSEMCTCGCGFTLAACRTYDTTCPVSLPRVEKLRDSVVAGRVASARGLRERPARALRGPH